MLRRSGWRQGPHLSGRRGADGPLRGGAAASGVEPEQRVVFILPDSPELAAGYLAAMKIGAVSVPAIRCSAPPITRTSWRRAGRASGHLARVHRARRARPRREGGAPPRAGGGRERRAQLRALDGGDAGAEGSGGRDQPRRAGVLALDQRLHRSPEGGRPRAPGLAALLRAVRARRARPRPQDRRFSASKLFHAYGTGERVRRFPSGWAAAPRSRPTGPRRI